MFMFSPLNSSMRSLDSGPGKDNTVYIEVTSYRPTLLSSGKWFSIHSKILVCCWVGLTMKKEFSSLRTRRQSFS